jgi:DNA-directed RNA polymerase specialized sigma24 family protein
VDEAMMEDQELVIACQNGSSRALTEVYQRHKQDLLVLALALLNDHASAEDAVQDVFAHFVQHTDRFQKKGSLLAVPARLEKQLKIPV